MSRPWLFYKLHIDGPLSQVEFRRVESGQISDLLPNSLCGTIVIDDPDIEREIKRLVKISGWVGEPPRDASSPLGQTILNGAW